MSIEKPEFAITKDDICRVAISETAYEELGFDTYVHPPLEWVILAEQDGKFAACATDEHGSVWSALFDPDGMVHESEIDAFVQLVRWKHE